MPGKIAAAHHTLADWDFQHGATYRSLSAIRFISAPTSLRYSGAPGAWESAILCRIPGTQVLPQGEIRFHAYRILTWTYGALFRNQAALGSASLD
ncbi:unnamed protein product, partial [marine sediment metagenome]